MRQAVRLERTPCRFGGDRPWFCCPRCERRVALLYLRGGAFRCRHCHGLAYASTRQGANRRLLGKADRLRRGLEGQEGLGSVPPRPAWMSPRAYWRTMHRILDLDGAYAAALAGSGEVEALLARLRGVDD